MPYAQPVQSVLRAIDVLEAVAASDGDLTLAQLSEQLGLRRTTVANLVRTLQLRGYISRETSRSPLKLGLSARRLVEQADASEMIQRATQGLAELTGRYPPLCGALSEWVNGETRMLLCNDPYRPGQFERPHHHILNPYVMAQSLVFLAFGAETLLENTFERYNFNTYAKGLFQTREQLMQALAQARQVGYVCPAIKANGLWRVACPIYNSRNTLVAALGIYSYQPPPESQRHTVITELLTLGRNIAQTPQANTSQAPQ